MRIKALFFVMVGVTLSHISSLSYIDVGVGAFAVCSNNALGKQIDCANLFPRGVTRINFELIFGSRFTGNCVVSDFWHSFKDYFLNDWDSTYWNAVKSARVLTRLTAECQAQEGQI